MAQQPVQGRGFCVPEATTQEYSGDGQGSAHSAGVQDHQSGGLELRGANGVLSITEHTRNVAPCLLSNVVFLPKYLQQRRGSSYKQGGGRQRCKLEQGTKGWETSNQWRPHQPQWQLGMVGGNGHKGWWRRARAMGSFWRRSYGHLQGSLGHTLVSTYGTVLYHDSCHDQGVRRVP